MNIGQTPDRDHPPVDTAAEPTTATETDPGSAAVTTAGAVRPKGPLAGLVPGGAKPASPAARPTSAAAKPSSPAAKPQPAAGPGRPGSSASQSQSVGDSSAGGGSTGNAGEAVSESGGKESVAGGRVAQGATPKGGPTKGGPTKGRAAAGKPTAEGRPQPTAPATAAVKLAPPSLRQPLAGDLQAELERELAAAGALDDFLGGMAGMANRSEPLQEGQRIHGVILKIHQDSVFVQLGGPDEGVLPFEQFSESEPNIGDSIEVVVVGLSAADGLYQLTLPGEAVSVTDWSDIESGSVVEATVTASNSGGLECTVAGIRGFMPISQISEHRVEDTTEFVGQKFLCLVTEANPRRGNLVLSRRAILERERQERRQQQIDQIEAGDLLEGVIRSVKDFGAFVDLGGLEGLIHISKLSWERIKHPSEVVEEGQKVKVKVDKIDKQTGKLSLSYRDLLENPWDTAAASIAPGSVMSGTVTRIAAFGAFVRIAAGVEGLVHISEIANHRVSNVASFLSEGQAVDVKVLSIDPDSQKIALSIKQAQHKAEEAAPEDEETELEPAQPVIRPQHSGPLRGGHDKPTGGERFGLRW